MTKLTNSENAHPNPLSTLTRRTVFAAIPAIATALPAPSKCIEPDPIFGLIDAHREAIRKIDEGAGDDWEDLTYESLDAQVEMLSTSPTTLAGCAAALRYAAELGPEDCMAFGGWDGEEAEAGAQFLPMIANALERLRT